MNNLEEKNLILSNWKLLLENYDTIINNEKYGNYIVTSFPLKTSVCCCMGNSLGSCYLKDLLTAWKNGFMYNDMPIIHSYGRNGLIYIECINDKGEIIKIENVWKPFNKYSKPKQTNEITLNEIINVIKKDED